MTIVARMAAAIPRLLGSLAAEAASDSNVIVRQRTFDPVSLAKTFLWGTLRKPDSSDEHLAQVAANAGSPSPPRPSPNVTRRPWPSFWKSCSARP